MSDERDNAHLLRLPQCRRKLGRPWWDRYIFVSLCLKRAAATANFGMRQPPAFDYAPHASLRQHYSYFRLQIIGYISQSLMPNDLIDGYYTNSVSTAYWLWLVLVFFSFMKRDDIKIFYFIFGWCRKGLNDITLSSASEIIFYGRKLWEVSFHFYIYCVLFDIALSHTGF